MRWLPASSDSSSPSEFESQPSQSLSSRRRAAGLSECGSTMLDPSDDQGYDWEVLAIRLQDEDENAAHTILAEQAAWFEEDGRDASDDPEGAEALEVEVQLAADRGAAFDAVCRECGGTSGAS